MYVCSGVTCHLHFWQNDRGLLRATTVTGVERTPNTSKHTKLTPEKKILPPLLPGFELATFRSRVRRSNQQAIPVAYKQVLSPVLLFSATREVTATRFFFFFNMVYISRAWHWQLI